MNSENIHSDSIEPQKTEIELDIRNDQSTENSSILPESPHAEHKENYHESVKNPRWIGRTMAFWYKNGSPIFTIGPHCIFK